MIDADQGLKILVTRLSAIGDCILTLPTVCALRDHFPHAQIVWAVEPAAAELISPHRAVDQWIIVPKRWMKSARTIQAIRQQLRSHRFDWTIDPQSLTKSCMLAWLSGAKKRIGFSRPCGREVAPWMNNVLVDHLAPHVVDASLGLLRPLGIENAPVRFDLDLPSDALGSAEQYVRNTHLTGGFAVLNVGASCACRQWPPERLGRVARYLGEKHNLPSIVTWGGEHEHTTARQVVAKAGGHAFLAPDTSLKELGAFLQRARMVVASDTGPLHLAAAVGTPCVSLHADTRAENSGAYGSQHAHVQVQCRRIRNRRKRRQDDSAIRRITVEEVCAACEKLLQPLPVARRTPHAA